MKIKREMPLISVFTWENYVRSSFLSDAYLGN